MSAPDAVRTPLEDIQPIAEHIVKTLSPYCHRIEIAGSIRRQKPMIGDIEIISIPLRPVDLLGQVLLDQPTRLDSFLSSKGVKFSKRGTKYQQFQYGRHVVDLFLTTPEAYGSVKTIRTGSADFSHWLVTDRAAGGACPAAVGFRDNRLYAYGRLLATPEEEDVFAAIGLPWIEPRLRTGRIEKPEWITPAWNYEGE